MANATIITNTRVRGLEEAKVAFGAADNAVVSVEIPASPTQRLLILAIIAHYTGIPAAGAKHATLVKGGVTIGTFDCQKEAGVDRRDVLSRLEFAINEGCTCDLPASGGAPSIGSLIVFYDYEG